MVIICVASRAGLDFAHFRSICQYAPAKGYFLQKSRGRFWSKPSSQKQSLGPALGRRTKKDYSSYNAYKSDKRRNLW